MTSSGSTAPLILDHARERHEELRDLHDAIVAYLETEPVHAGRFDVLRVVSKSRLRRLHVELATAVNAYGVALNEAEVDVPDYAVERVGRHCGPLLDIDAVQDAVVGTARDAVGAGADAALDVGRWLGTATTTTWQRIRPAAAARDPATPDNAGG